MANAAAIIAIVVTWALLVMLALGLLGNALAILAPGFTLLNALCAILPMLGAVIRPLVLLVALVVRPLVLWPSVILVYIGIALLRMPGMLVMIGPLLLVVPRLLILMARVIVVLLHLVRLGINARALAIHLPMRLLGDDDTGLRSVGARVLCIHPAMVGGCT